MKYPSFLFSFIWNFTVENRLKSSDSARVTHLFYLINMENEQTEEIQTNLHYEMHSAELCFNDTLCDLLCWTWSWRYMHIAVCMLCISSIKTNIRIYLLLLLWLWLHTGPLLNYKLQCLLIHYLLIAVAVAIAGNIHFRDWKEKEHKHATHSTCKQCDSFFSLARMQRRARSRGQGRGGGWRWWRQLSALNRKNVFEWLKIEDRPSDGSREVAENH